MDFLRKIFLQIRHFFQKFFKKWGKAPSFYEKIQKEKQKKYLFHRKIEEGTIYNRGKNRKKWPLPKTFSAFFQRPLDHIAGNNSTRKIMLSISAFIFLMVAYIVFFSPYFRISPNKVIIEPLTDGIDISAVQRAIEPLYGQSIFWFDQKKVKDDIRDVLKNTDTIKIGRLFPNGAKILITSLPIRFDADIYGIPDDKKFGISDNGVLIPAVDTKFDKIKNHLQIISKNLADEAFLAYKKTISDRMMMMIAKTFDLFAKTWPDLPISYANYFLSENELHLTIESGTKIIFAFQYEFENPSKDQPKALIQQFLTLKTYIDSYKKLLQSGEIIYLDVRIPGKIFVCAERNNCYHNLREVYGNAYK